MTKYFVKYRPGMKKGKNGKYYYPKKKGKQMVRYNKRRPRYTGNMIISKPLLPQAQKVCLKYFTRIQIDPVAVRSLSTDTAQPMAFHKFAFNDPFDIDKTHSLVSQAAHTAGNSLEDGARDHQPRMYDQYSTFYEKITCLGCKVKATFSNSNRITLVTQDTVHSGTPATHTETINNTRVVEPLPCYVGYMNSQWYDEAVCSERYDDAREKGEMRYRKLIDSDKPQTLVAKWSINKDPVYKSQLPLHTSHEAPENFGAVFGQSPTNLRFCHLFAHPITTANGQDPAPIDVEVEISQICLLTGRKEIAQS